jgi:hypothetical protein
MGHSMGTLLLRTRHFSRSTLGWGPQLTGELERNFTVLRPFPGTAAAFSARWRHAAHCTTLY